MGFGRKISSGVLVSVLTLGGLGLANPQASAAGASKMGSGGGLRYCVRDGLGVNLNPIASLNAGTPLDMVCYKDDAKAVGAYESNRWFYVVLADGTNRKGFVHSSRIPYPGQPGGQTVVPKCTTHRGVSAATWAAEHINIATTTPDERTKIGISNLYWAGQLRRLLLWRGPHRGWGTPSSAGRRET